MFRDIRRCVSLTFHWIPCARLPFGPCITCGAPATADATAKAELPGPPQIPPRPALPKFGADAPKEPAHLDLPPVPDPPSRAPPNVPDPRSHAYNEVVMPIAQWLCPYWNGTVERPRSIEWNRGQTHSAVVMPVTRAEGVGLLWDLRCLSFCPLSMVHGDHAGMLFRYMVVAVDLELFVPEKQCTFFGGKFEITTLLTQSCKGFRIKSTNISFLLL